MKEALGHDNEKEVEQNRSENSRGNEGDNESDEQWISVSRKMKRWVSRLNQMMEAVHLMRR